MDSKALATGATILLFVMLGVVFLSFIGPTTNLAGINPIGVLAATFTAGIGILWLIRPQGESQVAYVTEAGDLSTSYASAYCRGSVLTSRFPP